jgi:hypothetical protein
MLVSVAPGATAGLQPGERVGVAVFVVVVVVLYLLPTIVAAVRRVPNAAAIAVLNVLLGWTIRWWVVSLAAACQHVARAPDAAMTAPPGVGPGWYQDPLRAGRIRYHDGVGWTDHVAAPTLTR